MFIGGDQEGAHHASYLAVEWNGREKEPSIGRSIQGHVFDWGLPLFQWVEAYRTVVYIQNKCPHTTLGRKTPEEVFIGTRPNVSHLHIFGSVCL